jgi:hypothetical protein
MATKAYQQGDVLLKVVDALPKGAKRVGARAGRFVLAEGEATGHAHAVLEAPGVGLFERDGTLYLRCAETVEVVHEEHLAQTVAPGVYEVGRVVEVDPFENAIRTVAD